MESQIVLKDILGGERKTLEEFLAITPLATCDENRTVLAAILPSHPNLNAKPEPGGEISYVLKIARPTSEMWFRLPPNLVYRALRITSVAPVVHFEIDTADRTVTTNMQELARKMAEWVVCTIPEREVAFASLVDEYELPTPKAKPDAFYSKVLGKVKPNEFGDMWEAEPIAVPYLDGRLLPIQLYGITANDAEQIDTALGKFLALGPKDRDADSPRVLANCHEFLGMVGAETTEDQEMMAISDATETWKYVSCECIQIVRHDSNQGPSIYVSLICDCAWEEEHGLQLVFRNGRTLTRVSAQDGHVE